MDETEIQELLAIHRGRNEEMSELLQLSGVNSMQPRLFNIFFYAADEERARSLGRRLVDHDASNVHVRPPDGLEDAWAVEGQLATSLNEIAGDRFTETFVRLAAASDADYHGWDLAREPLPS